MKCYVINLDRSADRLAHMRREFDRIGLLFVRMPAVDGNDIPESDGLSEPDGVDSARGSRKNARPDADGHTADR